MLDTYKARASVFTLSHTSLGKKTDNFVLKCFPFRKIYSWISTMQTSPPLLDSKSHGELAGGWGGGG